MLLVFFITSLPAPAPSHILQLIRNIIGKVTGIFLIGGGGGGDAGGDVRGTTASNAGVALAVTALAGLALAAAVFYNSR